MSRPERGLAYCRGRLKRSFDVLACLVCLPLLAPFLALVALFVLVSSGRPVMFDQVRIGLEGRPFRLRKFRTMRREAPAGLPLTGRGDRRVTPAGRLLRSLKMDELPQLLNVLKGEMSLVGPRPEVPRYVAAYTEEQRLVLRVRPGLTDPATVAFRDEESLLGAVAEDLRESFYLSEILPRKLRMNLQYVEEAGFRYDLVLIARTLVSIIVPARG
jgi:lipopolysaccharide/colanic/teichoic acid biosynthesis glycosyltransferase